MPARTKIFIMVSVLVLILLGVSVALLLVKHRANSQPTQGGGTPTSTGSAATGGQVPGAGSSGQTTFPVKPLSSEETTKFGVKQLAKIFVERYYSYSTDSNFQNIKDVQTMVTPALWAKISAPLSAAGAPSTNFTGITTAAVSTSVDSYEDSKIACTVEARQEVDKNGVTINQNQNYKVTLVKQGSDWLISAVEPTK